ncbi:HEAT repeat domain-containing protein [Massilia sp. ST3]|uniref:HEAT repeat domain-containing protein n=1 Tax=Massilia sp. ST3 TaxID=2824903 RepID=UPI001B83A9B5|nr:HEAT repeat domain-containing protein [Massilia sp. ST3]MBQ5948024.1 HEAT repeat domain-containing protein [Massilia sp. ST3]
MAIAQSPDTFVTVAVWTGAVALALTLLLSIQILLMRLSLRRRERREARVLARWRPLLNQAIVGEHPSLPVLEPGERLPFLRLWVHLQGSLRGEATDALNALARELGADRLARAFLARGARQERLLAVLVLGHLRDREAWPQLLPLAELSDSALSLTALWALVRVDPEAAAEYLTPLFIEREDWALSHVAGILQQAAAPTAAVLGRVLPTLPAERLPRALRIAEALRVPLPGPVLAGSLRSSAVPVVIAGLRSVITPETIAEVRALLTHEDWQVRVQAARALGRIGAREDAERLRALLADPQWWVRYRAAQALRELPALSRADLEQLRDSLTDRFAADMLQQVLAEEETA